MVVEVIWADFDGSGTPPEDSSCRCLADWSQRQTGLNGRLHVGTEVFEAIAEALVDLGSGSHDLIEALATTEPVVPTVPLDDVVAVTAVASPSSPMNETADGWPIRSARRMLLRPGNGVLPMNSLASSTTPQ